MCSLPKEEEPQVPEVMRGRHAIPGIAQIPLDQIKTTNEEMQKMFVLTEFFDEAHADAVRETACGSYTVQCEDHTSFAGRTRNSDGTVTTHTGSAPYTSFTELLQGHDEDPEAWMDAQIEEMGTVKIVVIPTSPGAQALFRYEGLLPYLLVQSAGNYRPTRAPEILFASDVFSKPTTQAAIRANSLLFAAGWDRDENGNYIRHRGSLGCKGADDGCLWTQFDFEGIGGGTSFSAPNLGAALASVLAVFPDTTHQNLAKFAKACAKKSGQGIGMLLREYGGYGVADFTCMGGVTQALANLPTDGRTDVDINGQTVSVGRRDVILTFMPTIAFSSASESTMTVYGVAMPANMEGIKLFLNAVPTGDEEMMVVGGVKKGGLFASAAFGAKEDFFGFSDGHGNVRSARLTAGHENVFAHISQEQSSGGEFIGRAVGQSAGLTVREEFALTDDSALEVLMQSEKFLDGQADIRVNDVPFSSVRLNGGGWNHRLGLSSTTHVGETGEIGISADFHIRENGRDNMAVGVRYKVAF